MHVALSKQLMGFSPFSFGSAKPSASAAHVAAAQHKSSPLQACSASSSGFYLPSFVGSWRLQASRHSLCPTPAPAPAAAPSGRKAQRTCAATPDMAVAAAAAAAAAAPAVKTTAAGSTAAVVAASSPLVTTIAKLLGWGCIAGSCFRSVPQIAKVIKNRSAEGLSLTGNLMELLCYTVIVAYNVNQGYAFNTFGEVFACWVQDIVLIGLIFRHLALSPAVAASAAAGFVALCAFLFSGGCPLQVLALLQLSTIGMMALGSRLPQILLNIRRGNAGMLSVTTCGLNVAGNVIRLFTTSVLTQDWSLLAGAGIQGVMNSILLYQSLRTELGRRRQQAATGPAMGMA